MINKLFFAAALLVPGLALAGNPSADLSVKVVPAGTSGGVATTLPTPPAGYHWVQTFGDEFSGSTDSKCISPGCIGVNTNVWAISHFCGQNNFTTYDPPTYGCNLSNGGDAASVVSNGNLSMTIGDVTGSLADAAENIMSTTGPSPFNQRYGFFVYRARMPAAANGQLCNVEIDLESFAVQSGVNGQYGEMAWAQPFSVCGEPFNMSSYVIEDGQGIACMICGGIGANQGFDPSADFHQYGLWWKNDGTAHGTAQTYVDGQPIGSPYTFQQAVWDSGLFFDIFYAGTGNGSVPENDPMLFDWIRAYQLAPN